LTRAAALAAALCLEGAIGCGTSPPSTFYALSAQSGTAERSPVHTLKLRRPAIAGYLDRQVIVKTVVNHRLGLVDTDRWAAPLDEMLGRVLAQDVEQRLAGSVVFTEDGAITADANLTLEVDVRRFDVGDGGKVNLVAEIAMEKGDAHAPLGTRTIELQQVPQGPTTQALVAAMSDLVGKLADAIAALVQGAALGNVTPAAASPSP
jgi:uncharacterized lipoprotein YmbA